jgi:hypothetical protein
VEKSSQMKNHYVYCSYEKAGRMYIGSRTCDCLIDEDAEYLGSYTDKSFNPTEKIILATFGHRREANAYEQYLHQLYQVDQNSYFANKVCATDVSGFYSCFYNKHQLKYTLYDLQKRGQLK